MLRIKILTSLLLIATLTSWGQKKEIKIATWNLEHLGSGGRGFPEVRQQIPARTDADFAAIAALIKDTLNLDIVGLQEVAISRIENQTSYSNELYRLTEELGEGWRYYLSHSSDDDFDPKMQNAFLYNSDEVTLVSKFEMPRPDIQIKGKSLFDRSPLVGYFELTNEKVKNRGFIVVNVHLASGQTNDENHLAAMVIIESNLNYYMGQNDISYRERDRIILGDFNDNPYKKDSEGNPVYIPTTYNYMLLKGYKNYVTDAFVTTRMNKKFNSIIDHYLVSKTLHDNAQETVANIYMPHDQTKEGLLNWRYIYSDHFPIYLTFKF